jgi:hypothetical protein
VQAQGTAPRHETQREEAAHDSNDNAGLKRAHADVSDERVTERTTPSHITPVKRSSAKTEPAKRHIVAEPPPQQPEPAPSTEPAATAVTLDEAPQRQARPLFDFFGMFGSHHDYDGDVREQTGAVAVPPPSAAVQAGHDARTGNAKSKVARRQRQQRTTVDQAGDPVAPDRDDSTERWNGDNWHSDHWHGDDPRSGWNDNRDNNW